MHFVHSLFHSGTGLLPTVGNVLAHIYRGFWGILHLLQHSYKAQHSYHGMLLVHVGPAL